MSTTIDLTSEAMFQLSDYAATVPGPRKDVLSALPSLDVTLPADYDEITFTRTLLGTLLGGNDAFVIVK